MINKIKFRNFVLIKELELEFYPEMNVISGETGAGKSVLVGGLNLVLGGTARGSFFYNKRENVYLEASFSIDEKNEELNDLIRQHEIDASDKDLFFVREINTNGKSASYINGRRVTNSIIKEFRNHLLDFHSQNEQLNLFNNDYQLYILDAYANLEALRSKYSDKYLEYQTQKKLLTSLVRRQGQNEDKARLYEYQVEEIDALQLQIGEDEELAQQYNVLSNAEDIVNISNEIVLELYEGENAVVDRLNSAINRLSEYRNSVAVINEALDFIHDGKNLLEDGISSLRAVEDTVSVDKEKLSAVEDRIRVIEEIKTKYRMNSIELILDYYHDINEFLLNQGSLTNEIKEAQEKLNKIEKDLYELAEKLSKKRQKSAERFEKEIKDNIRKLAIPNGEVEFRFSQVKDSSPLSNLNIHGKDEVNIFFSANLGMELQPIKESASGGELSRMLLSLKKILADKLQHKVMVFDEIDVGIGGNTALSIAEFIAEISNKHQILCITHLPQVAAIADNQFKIDKKDINNKTEIVINKLSKCEREEEIARMLSGFNSDTALKHAKELLIKSNIHHNK